MRTLLTLVLLVAACAHHPVAAPLVPPGPTPLVAASFADGGTCTGERLPAVSADGKRVAVLDADEIMGEPPAPGCSLLLLADGQKPDSVDLLTWDDSQGPPEDADAGIAGRVATANARLAAGAWVQLTAGTVTANAPSEDDLEAETPPPRQPSQGTVGELTLTYAEPRFTVTGPGGQVLLDRPMTAWSHDDANPACAGMEGEDGGEGGCARCHPPAYIDAAWADAGRHVMLVHVGYAMARGEMNCLYGPTYEVVRLP